jgi:predicted amidohydrolase YtcJ
MDADFAIVDADLSRIGDHEISSSAVAATWVRGQLAYQQ